MGQIFQCFSKGSWGTKIRVNNNNKLLKEKGNLKFNQGVVQLVLKTFHM